MGEKASRNGLVLPAEEITSLRIQKKNINLEHKDSLSFMEKIALYISDHVGTMGFFLIIIVWTVGWLGWNTIAQQLGLSGVFDRPYEFAVWLFISNMIQLFLLPLIIIGQNLHLRHSEMRAEQEFHITNQIEYELENVLRYLEAMDNKIKNIDERLQTIQKQKK